ncbi:Fructosamine/Ketosamine-3-kinase [Dichotomopilus funicola]|uniref:protein-ribulosamine 3-kinase n=1 Tax=Dichotomopilus funicola TaxID=1934379 RepID=A0AAN6V5K9_9PEZI|nr:Fructosamine/Ketosamine-3-kinase [Dichotomopilus funicola]
MFGFHLKPLRGNLSLETTWNASWSDYFVQIFRRSLALDQKVNGTRKDLRRLVELAITHVVPQVLGPLEADGRPIKPSLIHEDLWGGNIGTDSKTGEIYIFDASAHYAHYEMEIAIWRPHPLSVVGSGAYVSEYLAQMGASEPVEQFYDRQKLYSTCTVMHAAACHNGDWFREEIRENPRYLLEKYAPGLAVAGTCDDAS